MDHYGLDKLKKRVVEYLAVRQIKNSLRGPILCFVGPPGVGKTSVGRSIAKTLGREFHRCFNDVTCVCSNGHWVLASNGSHVDSRVLGIGPNMAETQTNCILIACNIVIHPQILRYLGFKTTNKTSLSPY